MFGFVSDMGTKAMVGDVTMARRSVEVKNFMFALDIEVQSWIFVFCETDGLDCTTPNRCELMTWSEGLSFKI